MHSDRWDYAWIFGENLTDKKIWNYKEAAEALSAATPRLPAATPEVFVEIPNSSRQCRNAAECSATLRIGENSIEFYQEIGTELLLAMIKGLRTC